MKYNSYNFNKKKGCDEMRAFGFFFALFWGIGYVYGIYGGAADLVVRLHTGPGAEGFFNFFLGYVFSTLSYVGVIMMGQHPKWETVNPRWLVVASAALVLSWIVYTILV